MVIHHSFEIENNGFFRLFFSTRRKNEGKKDLGGHAFPAVRADAHGPKRNGRLASAPYRERRKF
jgi:hypothetical protein